MMKDKKYQLVAWTRNVKENDGPEIRMIPSLLHEMEEPYSTEIRRLINNDGSARELADAYERNADFLFKSGQYGEGIRLLRQAAVTCIMNCDWDMDWCDFDTDLGSYDYFTGKTRGDFFRLYGKYRRMAVRYRRQDILLEKESSRLEELYEGQTSHERDLSRHLHAMKVWK